MIATTTAEPTTTAAERPNERIMRSGRARLEALTEQHQGLTAELQRLADEHGTLSARVDAADLSSDMLALAADNQRLALITARQRQVSAELTALEPQLDSARNQVQSFDRRIGEARRLLDALEQGGLVHPHVRTIPAGDLRAKAEQARALLASFGLDDRPVLVIEI